MSNWNVGSVGVGVGAAAGGLEVLGFGSAPAAFGVSAALAGVAGEAAACLAPDMTGAPPPTAAVGVTAGVVFGVFAGGALAAGGAACAAASGSRDAMTARASFMVCEELALLSIDVIRRVSSGDLCDLAWCVVLRLRR